MVRGDFRMTTNDEILQRVRADIATHGWHLVLVPAADRAPGWAHTIGLSERFGHPELLVFGSDLSFLRNLTNRLGAEVAGGAILAADSEIPGILAELPIAVRRVDPKWLEAFLGNAAWHYRERGFEALQCFWPDRAGRFPWDPESDPAWRADQPLLYLHETHRALSEVLLDRLRRERALSSGASEGG
jgi:hypothetical protein